MNGKRYGVALLIGFLTTYKAGATVARFAEPLRRIGPECLLVDVDGRHDSGLGMRNECASSSRRTRG